MFTEQKAAQDNKIMKILGITEIKHLIAHTNKGELTLMLRKGERAHDYRFVIDSVPLEDEKNDELKELYNIIA